MNFISTPINDLFIIQPRVFEDGRGHFFESYTNKSFEENGIHFDYVNENPEIATNLEGYGNYDKKPYMNVLFEDKAGFDGDTDWDSVLWLLTSKNGENI